MAKTTATTTKHVCPDGAYASSRETDKNQINEYKNKRLRVVSGAIQKDELGQGTKRGVESGFRWGDVKVS